MEIILSSIWEGSDHDQFTLNHQQNFFNFYWTAYMSKFTYW